MKRIIYPCFLLLVLAICGCKSSDKNSEFVVEGHLTPTSGEYIYLSHISHDGSVKMDSVCPKSDGSFLLRAKGHSWPELYSLTLAGQHIYFAADSATHIEIKASPATFSTGYELIEASEDNHNIRQIWFDKLSFEMKLDSFESQWRAGHIDAAAYSRRVIDELNEFKNKLCTEYIYKNPRSLAAYFALFQQKDGLSYFNVADPADAAAFGAVATAYDAYFPAAPYTPTLHQLALEAMAFKRQQQALARLKMEGQEKGVVVSFPELSFLDKGGREQSLTQVVSKHKTVLVVFASYEQAGAPLRIQKMRELYQEHKNEGFEIYDVSLDTDLHLWRNATERLPWVSVNDALGKSLPIYNITQLPSYFLIKDGEITRVDSPKAD